ncbi:nucleotidyl transferase AbiEii/AbiGii toxin family protein [Bariatricus massiliensis]|uniref:Nucleotidyl transferase AbiEii/AbiGii toxin family protein n=1 Tax=Bariatricus massiliensis TaxID=1745713 RepID=A0ABS8DEZ0_9FIRM|nr:nucleotidyl transferase AbiEii/AbiGii toxin family protein [Bariatricus massiliensis]MCB7303097.1 nucleotidyl transferase AbiEii/AbiGii toxin family protein [Bariatricus massiliensis]MCB7374313.1 nucleotidyl transferase AbiEii/AbiGii toxin family protein [Bariatricus massiliensis]MCB7386983.1 nucleotidyl transferase AbiEii/AbiGii toxin family protein [Bariatricus massiliensis]MCB7411145.1 nucleotidyl transferase AbiEii/AbiGii toxin family protein [Bariatricus massiliensis]MCQ5251971.1 nucle
MSSEAMSLKGKLKNLAKQKSVSAQILLQNYMFERLLERLSKSLYKDKFILKGGMLVAALVGIDNRSTMDIDATIRAFRLNEENFMMSMVD